MGKWQSIINDCQMAYKLDPTFYKIYFLIGISLSEMGRIEKDYDVWMKLLKEAQGKFDIGSFCLSKQLALEKHKVVGKSNIRDTILESKRKSKSIWYLKQQEHDKKYKVELMTYLADLDGMESSGDFKNTGMMADVEEILDTEDKLWGVANKHGLAPDIICCPITLVIILRLMVSGTDDRANYHTGWNFVRPGLIERTCSERGLY